MNGRRYEASNSVILEEIYGKPKEALTPGRAYRLDSGRVSFPSYTTGKSLLSR